MHAHQTLYLGAGLPAPPSSFLALLLPQNFLGCGYVVACMPHVVCPLLVAMSFHDSLSTRPRLISKVHCLCQPFGIVPLHLGLGYRLWQNPSACVPPHVGDSYMGEEKCTVGERKK